MKIPARLVAMLLFGILLGSLGISAVTYTPLSQTEGLTVTAATFPVYTIALNVVGDTPDVTVRCLIQPTVGCNHEYQLSPSERQLLASSQVILRGDGDEFLDAVLEAGSAVTPIETVKDGQRLPAFHHGHEEGDGHHHEDNPHSWVSPERYRRQVEAVRDGLCAADPVHADAYRRNAAAYLAKIEAVAAAFSAVSADGVVVFHESMAYAAEFLGLPVIATVPLGEEGDVLTADLAAATEAVQGKTVIFLYDKQVAVQTFGLEAYAARAMTVVWDTAVVPQDGVSPNDAWIYAMEQNRKEWEAAV